MVRAMVSCLLFVRNLRYDCSHSESLVATANFPYRTSRQIHLLHDNTILVVLLLVSRKLAMLRRLTLAALAQFFQARNGLRELES